MTPGADRNAVPRPAPRPLVTDLSAARWLLLGILAASIYFFHGFLIPVLAATIICVASWRIRERLAQRSGPTLAATLLVLVLISVVAARGTLRQGPPLRWGDAFTTDSMFANHLGLNGILLSGAAVYALVTAVGSLLTGGHPLQFGRAILYATVVLIVAIGMAIHNRHANRSIRSNFVALDVQGGELGDLLLDLG